MGPAVRLALTATATRQRRQGRCSVLCASPFRELYPALHACRKWGQLLWSSVKEGGNMVSSAGA